MNLNAFRVFLTVYETRSMTLAAEQLHLTQSGISQHIMSLESDLGFPLFERVKKKLFPTAVATEIYSRGKKGFADVEAAITSVTHAEQVPRGTVHVGLPIEFGNNVVIPEFVKLAQKNQELDFDIHFNFAIELSQLVLQGKLDMAVIDKFRVDPSLRMETVTSETLLLCGLKSYVKKNGPVKNNTQYFSKLHFIDYKEGEPIVRHWFRHHFHRQNIDIRTRARVFDVQGVAKFILSGLGAGILPDHVIQKLQQDGADLHIFEGRKAPLKNEMCLIYLPLKQRPLSHTVVMDSVRGLRGP